MKIKYNDGTERIVADDRDTIINCLQTDLGDHVIYAGFVWQDAGDYEGRNPGHVAELYESNGNLATNFA